MEDKAKQNTLIQDLFFFCQVSLKRSNSWLIVFILSHHSQFHKHQLIQKHSSASRLFVQVKYQTAKALLFISQASTSTRGGGGVGGWSDLCYNNNNYYYNEIHNILKEKKKHHVKGGMTVFLKM